MFAFCRRQILQKSVSIKSNTKNIYYGNIHSNLLGKKLEAHPKNLKFFSKEYKFKSAAKKLTVNKVQIPSQSLIGCNRSGCDGIGLKKSNFCTSPVPVVFYQNFHTSQPRKALPPVIITYLGRFAQFAFAAVGRWSRKWWAGLTEEQKVLYKKQARNRCLIPLIVILIACGAGGYTYYESHIQEAPFTKRRQFIAFSPDDFERLAKEEFKDQIEEHRKKIVPASLDDPLYSRVARVANRLLQANKDLEQIKGKEWTITVINDDSIDNAFVLPFGSIFVFSGILDSCEDDDELATILGHEMAHAVLQHSAEKASNDVLTDFALVLPVAFIWLILPNDVSAIFLHWITRKISKFTLELPYSRAIEDEADEVGLLLAAKACFDVRVSPVLWAKWAYLEENEGISNTEWLSTHPTHINRTKLLNEVLPEALSLRDGCQCPKLPFMNPGKRLEDFMTKVNATSKNRNVAIRLEV